MSFVRNKVFICIIIAYFTFQTSNLLLKCLQEAHFFSPSSQTHINILEQQLQLFVDSSSSDFHNDLKEQYSLEVFPESISSDSLKESGYIGGLLLRHICQLVCNAHAITVMTAVGEGMRVPQEKLILYIMVNMIFKGNFHMIITLSQYYGKSYFFF